MVETIYRCSDGKEFIDEDEAAQYDWDINHQNLKDIILRDIEGNIFTGDLMEEDTYLRIDSMYIPTDKAAEQLRGVGEICGWKDYQNVDAPGIWEFTNNIGVQTLVKVHDI